MNRLQTPIEKPITIEATEKEIFIHNFLMPKNVKKPKHVADFTAKFKEFTNLDRLDSSKSIYEASKYTHKIYSVNLRGEITWNEYISKLKKIQPDIEITELG